MPDIGAIEPAALKARLDRGEQVFILDVREPSEISIAPFPGASHIPMGDIPSRLTELDPDRETVVVCHHGVRSAQVGVVGEQPRFQIVQNLGVNLAPG